MAWIVAERIASGQKLDRNEREECHNAERDLKQSDTGKDQSAARERRARRGAHRRDRLKDCKDDDCIGDHPVVELRRRRIAEDRLQRSWTERLTGNQARSHQRPGVVDEAGA